MMPTVGSWSEYLASEWRDCEFRSIASVHWLSVPPIGTTCSKREDLIQSPSTLVVDVDDIKLVSSVAESVVVDNVEPAPGVIGVSSALHTSAQG